MVYDGSLIGFVCIMFEIGKVMVIFDYYYCKSDYNMYWMLLMSFVSGILFILLL